MAKIIFMGTPDFAVPSLQALIKTQEVVGVITQPDKPAGRGKKMRLSPVKTAALAANIPVYQPKSLRKESAVAPLKDWVVNMGADMIVVAAFGQILRPIVLDLPPHGCLNVHASLLPRWRGASPIQHAILAGDREAGVTLMRMDVGLDTGGMFVKNGIPIRSDETAVSLHDRLADLGAKMVERYLDRILSGDLLAVEQNNDASTYAPMIKKEDGRLQWQKTSAEIDRHIRAMSPWPGAFTSWEGKTLKIKRARLAEQAAVGEPGRVMQKNGKIMATTADGALILETIQLAGKRAMLSADFARGQTGFIGAKLGG